MSTIELPPPTKLSAADLLVMPDEVHYELVDGRLEIRHMGFESSRIALRLAMFLSLYCDRMKLGWVLGPDAGFQCFAQDTQRVRRADVSFISLKKIPLDYSPMGYIPVAPDLAVEVVSPNGLAEEVNTKVKDYLGAGVRLVWVIYPSQAQAWVYRPTGVTGLSAEDELSGEDVIPGFSVKISDVLNKFSN